MIQEILIGISFAGAVIMLVRIFTKKKDGACDKNCGCSTDNKPSWDQSN